MPLCCITTDPAPEPSQAQLERFRALIEERVGIYYPDSRRDALRRALAATMARCGVTDWDEYARLLACPKRGDAEFRGLLRHVIISETDFFRIPAHFEALRRVLVPAILKDRPQGPLSIWSAGCASGEEPYSIALTLADMGIALRRVDVHLFGTDVSADAIERARRGWYNERALRRVPPQQRERYFRRCSGGYEMRQGLRSCVTFQEFNLACGGQACARPRYPCPPAGAWDIIFCRNVLMYFRAPTIRQVMARFRGVLRPGGFLVLSPTEQLTCGDGDFETIEAAGAFIHVKPPLDEFCASLYRPGRRVARHTAAAAAPIRQDLAASNVGARHAVPLQKARVRPPRVSEHELCARALADIAAERWQQAEQSLAACAAQPWAVRAQLLLAWLRATRGKGDEAAALCLELLTRDPLLGPAHYILGLLACRAGDSDQGAEHLGRAIYSDCGLVPAYYHLGIVHYSQGDLVAARRAFRGGLRALDEGRNTWLDFSEGLTPDHWRRACEERLASLPDRA
jgi:chemotaxis protein methyltransferase CheR